MCVLLDLPKFHTASVLCYVIFLFSPCALMNRCTPIPSDDVFCRTTFRYSHFSLPVTDQLSMPITQVSSLSSNVSLSEECIRFFAFYQCIGTYTPCNATSMKIYAFCQDSCSTINSLAIQCLRFTTIDTRLQQYLLQFNCSNPLTYTSSLTLDYYDSPDDEMCSALRVYFG